MGYTPRLIAGPCPGCHSICGKPRLRTKLKWPTGVWVKLECQCGIAGAWQKSEPMEDQWNTALRGWAIIAPTPRSRPPRPMPLHPKGTAVYPKERLTR